MKKAMVLMALLLSSCASMQDGRSLDRTLKVCAFNALTNWMSAGTSAGITGDAKVVVDSIHNARIVEGICYENEQTLKEDL